ncbi:nucleoside hydrolase [Gilvimarinus sp. SDUM040013]|uniref:Nucleoside hydrolase n=1 Tax=Gilvimarinus gilvus TaxID=3058038 RepID=A0ABU4RZ50_9GAMM|nr:nucleoside hydrolase [Gilvimarinus sp. SDUM040013]MDO3384594.1 nucleoside hydrolase [Gilvimarinus sp. SDUM040013]MDX6850070.1 nucleoside hydrolase [Gilvimarinus sp. SDUM040013]
MSLVRWSVSWVCVLILSVSLSVSARTVILDADTANEVDDPYALVKAFSVPDWDIVAINAAQWQVSQWSTTNTMEQSHRINQEIAAYLELPSSIKVLRGGHRRIYDWGGDRAIYSSATHNLVQMAEQAAEGETITVIVLGALTNVASALLINPAIESKLDIYWLGSSFNADTERLKFLDFNPLMDPQAVDILLNSQARLHILPVSSLGKYVAEFTKAKQHFSGKGELGDYLIRRWREHRDGGKYQRILWDVALIQAVQYPEHFSKRKITSYSNRNLWVYDSVKNEFLLRDLYSSIEMRLTQ